MFPSSAKKRTSLSGCRSGDAIISLRKAEEQLMNELNYSRERAQFIARQFDKNSDGKLSAKEMELFRNSVKQTKKDLLAAFTSYDQNKDGRISTDEARLFLSREPFNLSEEKIDALLARFDLNKDGQLDYKEFLMFYPEAKATNETIMMQFNKLDKSGTGALPVRDLVVVVRQLTGYSEAQASQFLAAIDVNGDGLVDRREFTELWSLMFG